LPSLVDTRPIEAQCASSESSPKPDQQGFINYNDTSTLFTDTYVVEQQPPSLSPSDSSIGNFPHLPSKQIAWNDYMMHDPCPVPRASIASKTVSVVPDIDVHDA
jgi:hypothetical protein